MGSPRRAENREINPRGCSPLVDPLVGPLVDPLVGQKFAFACSTRRPTEMVVNSNQSKEGCWGRSERGRGKRHHGSQKKGGAIVHKRQHNSSHKELVPEHFPLFFRVRGATILK